MELFKRDSMRRENGRSLKDLDENRRDWDSGMLPAIDENRISLKILQARRMVQPRDTIQSNVYTNFEPVRFNDSAGYGRNSDRRAASDFHEVFWRLV